MPVSEEEVRLHIGQGLAELEALGTCAPDGLVLLWAQQHPDGPDWAVPDLQFMQWVAEQDAPDKLPMLSLAVNVGQGTVEIAARASTLQPAHARAPQRQGRARSATNAHAAKTSSTLRKETFQIDAENARADVIARAARRYVELAAQIFPVHAGSGQ